MINLNTLWKSRSDPLFKRKYLTRISREFSKYLVTLSSNGALTVVAIRHVANQSFYDTDVSYVVNHCESKLGSRDALTRMNISRKDELEAAIKDAAFDNLASAFFEWFYDRLPILLLRNRPDGRTPDAQEIEYISRACFMAGHDAFETFRTRDLRFPGGYYAMMKWAKQSRPNKEKLSAAIYDAKWMDLVFQDTYPDLLASTNQAVFAKTILDGCFPMFYDNLVGYYRGMTLDISNFGWCYHQPEGFEMFKDRNDLDEEFPWAKQE